VAQCAERHRAALPRPADGERSDAGVPPGAARGLGPPRLGRGRRPPRRAAAPRGKEDRPHETQTPRSHPGLLLRRATGSVGLRGPAPTGAPSRGTDNARGALFDSSLADRQGLGEATFPQSMKCTAHTHLRAYLSAFLERSTTPTTRRATLVAASVTLAWS